MINRWTTGRRLLRREERAYLLPVLGSRGLEPPTRARVLVGLPTLLGPAVRDAADGSVVLAPDAGAASATSAGGVFVAPLTRPVHATSDAPPAHSTRPTG